jgi:hypothetical protein
MRDLEHPTEIDDQANLTRSLNTRSSQDTARPFQATILDAYQRYSTDAPELVNYIGLNMPAPAKTRMLQIYEWTKKGSLLNIREALRRNCLRCPYCNISTAPDIDHFLSKDRFPCLAIYSWNLVPICPECNRLKERGPEGAFIHSYFDEFPNTPFLMAAVTFEAAMVLITYQLDLNGIEPEFSDRITNHFEKLDLARRYSLVAQERLSAYRLSLPDVLRTGGAMAVRLELERRRLEASLLGRNSWDWALLAALISSQDYCEGRFGG